MKKPIKQTRVSKGETSFSRDKGTTGQAQNLAKGWAGSGQPLKLRDRTKRDRAEKDILKQKKDVL